MSDPDRLTSPHDDKFFGPDTRGLIHRIIVIAFFGMLFWAFIALAVGLFKVGRIEGAIR